MNLYERVDVGAQEISIRFVLDISEFPALRERAFADTNDDGAVDDAETTAYLDGFWQYLEPLLKLVVDDRRCPFTAFTSGSRFLPGRAALLDARRIRSIGDATGTDVRCRGRGLAHETAFDGVPGWHEMIVRAANGVTLVQSSVPDTDVTHELTAYPPELLTAPLSVREADFTYRVDQPSATPLPTANSPATAAPSTIEPGTGPRPTDPMISLLGQRLDWFSTLAGLVLASALGAIHALTPGHGKTLVAAYLVGTRANVSQGLWLGGTVAVTHTAGIFVLGLATLAFTQLVVPERVVGWLSVATGVLIVALGAVFVWRSQQLQATLEPVPVIASGSSNARSEHRATRIATALGGTHTHDAELTPELKRRDVAVLGVVGGLVPSGSALILLLSAVALNEFAYGLLLIVAFGVGMAAVLAGVSTGNSLSAQIRGHGLGALARPAIATDSRVATNCVRSARCFPGTVFDA